MITRILAGTTLAAAALAGWFYTQGLSQDAALAESRAEIAALATSLSVARANLATERLQRAALPAGTIVAPVVAEEASGRNKFPHALAYRIADSIGLQVSDDIVQKNRAQHTGAKAAERLMVRAVFDGDVQAGRDYLLVDDVTVMGSTLADMASHLVSGRGRVAGVALLADASREGITAPTPATVRKIEGRFGNDLSDLIQIDAAALTASEAKHVLDYRDADALRDRLAKARRERQSRLDPRGNEPVSGGESQAVAPEGEPEPAATVLPGDTSSSDPVAIGDRLRGMTIEKMQDLRIAA